MTPYLSYHLCCLRSISKLPNTCCSSVMTNYNIGTKYTTSNAIIKDNIDVVHGTPLACLSTIAGLQAFRSKTHMPGLTLKGFTIHQSWGFLHLTSHDIRSSSEEAPQPYQCMNNSKINVIKPPNPGKGETLGVSTILSSFHIFLLVAYRGLSLNYILRQM